MSLARRKSAIELHLASRSPRRRELLGQLAVHFDVINADIDETPQPGEDPRSYVRRMADSKAAAGAKTCADDLPLLAADTIVALDGKILGKPKDEADACAMLAAMSGCSHEVLTAITVQTPGQQLSGLSCTQVVFRDLSDKEIQTYWDSGEPVDKAGAYGIQGLAAAFVKEIHGSYTGVVGLPLCETRELLLEAGVSID